MCCLQYNLMTLATFTSSLDRAPPPFLGRPGEVQCPVHLLQATSHLAQLVSTNTLCFSMLSQCSSKSRIASSSSPEKQPESEKPAYSSANRTLAYNVLAMGGTSHYSLTSVELVHHYITITSNIRSHRVSDYFLFSSIDAWRNGLHGGVRVREWCFVF